MELPESPLAPVDIASKEVYASRGRAEGRKLASRPGAQALFEAGTFAIDFGSELDPASNWVPATVLGSKESSLIVTTTLTERQLVLKYEAFIIYHIRRME